MPISEVYQISKQIHIANRVTPVLFNLFSKNILSEMRKIGTSRIADGTDVLGSLPTEREAWKYPYFIQDNRDPIGNFEVQGGSYPYLFSNVNDQPGTYNFFFPINSEDVVESDTGLKIASAVGAFIGEKTGERTVAGGLTYSVYEEIEARHLYFNMLLNPGSREILRSSNESPSPRPSGKSLQPIPEATINYLYLNVLGKKFPDNEKEVDQIYMVRDFGGGAGQRGYELAGKIRPTNRETKKELFKREILPLLKNFFETALNWENIQEKQEDAIKKFLNDKGVTSVEELTEGQQNIINSNIQKTNDIIYHLKLKEVPIAVLQLVKTWLYNPENEDVMFDALVEKFETLNFDLGNGIVDFRGSGGELADTKRKEADIILNSITNPDYRADGYDSAVNIFKFIGFAEAIEEETGEEYDPRAVVAGLASSNLGFLESFLLMNNAIAGEADLTNLELQEKLQCFLMSGLLFPDGDTKDWGSYWNIETTSGTTISPLSGKFKPVNSADIDIDGDGEVDAGTKGLDSWNAHNRIYPVTPAFDSRDFMNKAFVGEDTKNIFKEIAEDQPKKGKTGGGTLHDQFFKQLWWVHDDGGVLKETEIKLSSKLVTAAEGLASAKFETALEYLNSPVLSEREKAQRIKQLNLGLTKTVIGPNGAEDNVPVENVTPDIVFAKLNEIQSKLEKKLRGSDNNEYYYIEQILIDFKGTTPATARNDVTVEFQFNLSSMKALEKSMTPLVTIGGGENDAFNQENFDIKLWDLITFPQTSELSKGFGRDKAKQFNPEYNRIRLKVAAKSDYDSNLIIDLNTVDYNFNRVGDGGETTMTVNMRGFFETVLNMPENDILTSADNRDKRETAKNNTKSKIEALNSLPVNADEETIKAAKEAVEEAEASEREVTVAQRRDPASLMASMNTYGQMHSFSVKNYDSLKAMKDENPRITKNVIKAVRYGQTFNGASGFFFLGDLLYYAMDAIYKQGKAEHYDSTKMMNMRYIIAPIEVPRETSTGKIEYVKINPLCIPILEKFFKEWYNDVVLKKNLSVYRIGIFIRELIERLVNKIIFNTCFSGEKSLMMPPQIRDTFVSTTENDWYKKDENYFFNPDRPYNEDASIEKKKVAPFLKKSIFVNEVQTTDRTNQSRVLQQTNYCLIYPSYVDAIQGLAKVTKVADEDTLKRQEYTPEIFYGRKNANFNFITNMQLSKTNVPFLREARYSNTDYGSLSLLSNVYDLSFSFISKGANTVLYPGVILNFILLDWGDQSFTNISPYEKLETSNFNYTTAFGESNPHDVKTKAHLLGMGGYFIISSVQYILGQTSADFEIKISAKFNGMDGQNTKRSDHDTRELSADTSSASGEAIVIGGGAATTVANVEPEPTAESSSSADESSESGETEVKPDASEPAVLPGVSNENISLIAQKIITEKYLNQFSGLEEMVYSFDETQPDQGKFGELAVFEGSRPSVKQETEDITVKAVNILDELKIKYQSFNLKGTEKNKSGKSAGIMFIYTANPATNLGTIKIVYLAEGG